MDGAQYLRRLECVIGNTAQALDFSDLRVSFRIHRGDFQTPNTADIRIWNVAPETANLLQNEFTDVVLSAGYQDSNFGQIFQGSIKQVRQGRIDQKDSYVDVTAADGDEAYNFASIVYSLAAGRPPKDHVQAMLQTMAKLEIGRGAVPDFTTNALPRGCVFYGATKDELRDFSITNDVNWSIQDGLLTFIPVAGPIQSGVIIVSPDTGLVGVPEQTQNGISVRADLNPNLKIGQVIQITDTINQLRLDISPLSQGDNQVFQKTTGKLNGQGFYYVMVADHFGDTRGNDWYTDMICLAVDAEIPPNSTLVDQQAVITATGIPRF